MKKIITTALAAVTMAGAMAATAAPAEARDYGRRGDYGRHHRGGNDAGVAVAAGVVGLALGAAIAGSNSDRGGYYSDRGGSYGRGYYEPRPAYGYYRAPPARYAYSTCESRDRVYDPYMGRSVVVTRRYAC